MEQAKQSSRSNKREHALLERRHFLLATWILIAVGFSWWSLSRPKPKTVYFARIVEAFRDIKTEPIVVAEKVKKVLADAQTDGHSFEGRDIFFASMHWRLNQACREIFIAYFEGDIDRQFFESQLRFDDLSSQFYQTTACREQIRAWSKSVYPATRRLVRVLRAGTQIR